jgi:aspartate/methionine/tyrosine aminotransferase
MEENWQPDLTQLASLVNNKTKLIIINNPNNPTGSLMREKQLKEICEIAESVDAFVLSDESYRGIYVNPKDSVPSVVELCARGIATGSFSKPYSLTGIRLGWITARKRLIELISEHRNYTTISTGMIDDAIAALAMKNIGLIIRRNQKIIDKNYKVLSNWIADEPLIDWVSPVAGSVSFLKYAFSISSEELCLRLLKDKGVLLVPGICFEMDGFLRIGWGGNTDNLSEGLSRFKSFLDGYRI